MSESRSVFRCRMQWPAKIFLKDGSAFECLVRDLSTKGARLEVVDDVKVPDGFFINYLPDARQHSAMPSRPAKSWMNCQATRPEREPRVVAHSSAS